MAAGVTGVWILVVLNGKCTQIHVWPCKNTPRTVKSAECMILRVPVNATWNMPLGVFCAVKNDYLLFFFLRYLAVSQPYKIWLSKKFLHQICISEHHNCVVITKKNKKWDKPAGSRVGREFAGFGRLSGMRELKKLFLIAHIAS